MKKGKEKRSTILTGEIFFIFALFSLFLTPGKESFGLGFMREKLVLQRTTEKKIECL